MALDPKTMVVTLEILISVKMEEYYGGERRPEDLATLDCLIAQRNYWASK